MNPILIYIYVYRKFRLAEIHTFYLGGTIDYYRASVSLNAFRTANCRMVNNSDGLPIDMFCAIKDGWEHQLELESNLRLSKLGKGFFSRRVKLKGHASIWYFYKYIGYDYKTKRYTK